jgi:medium-chain acyl-[acyl-carrier-protein] hydrolase
MSDSKPTRWLAYYKRNPAAVVRLFCFPYAGGGAQVFIHWSDLERQQRNGMGSVIDICPVQLPGREGRITELPFTSVSAIASEAASALLPFLDIPFAFFGHSLGAVIAYEVTQQLRSAGKPQPGLLFVSARRAPQVPYRGATTWHLPDADFRNRLRQLDGTPEAVLENDELMELMFPVLRADFQCDEMYSHSHAHELIDCPIVAFGGARDRETLSSDLVAWAGVTRGGFHVQRVFDAGHFYIHSHASEIVTEVAHVLRSCLGNSSNPHVWLNQSP